MKVPTENAMRAVESFKSLRISLAKNDEQIMLQLAHAIDSTTHLPELLSVAKASADFYFGVIESRELEKRLSAYRDLLAPLKTNSGSTRTAAEAAKAVKS